MELGDGSPDIFGLASHSPSKPSPNGISWGRRASGLLGGSWVVISRVYGVPLRVPLKGSIGLLGFRVHG